MSAEVSRRLIVGVGNAGVTVLDMLAMAEPSLKGLLAVNNDPESLAGTVVRDRLTVPAGDPADGFLAIDEEFGKAVAGASFVVFCGGLGGETASFLLPALAILAKSSGVTVAACVGMPFAFEGKHRTELAETALEKLHAVCDAVAVIVAQVDGKVLEILLVDVRDHAAPRQADAEDCMDLRELL